MTHKDIYTKYLIEYDKANVTSSYPSLTKYEIATILDRAYLALISQKFTGNNLRRSSFESDAKAVEDLQPLILTTHLSQKSQDDTKPLPLATNVLRRELPDDMLYYVSSIVRLVRNDKQDYRIASIRLVDHNTATKFFTTTSNKPWIKTPVAYIEDNRFYVVYDEYYFYGLNDDEAGPQSAETFYNDEYGTQVMLTYIKVPNKFQTGSTYDFSEDSVFELSDAMAEELISLAVTLAVENVESTRLNTKLNTRILEQ